jgi:hypothetical protein
VRTAFRTAKPVDAGARVDHPRGGHGGMTDFVNKIDAWITAFFDVLSAMIGGVVHALEAPAQAIGIPAGVFAALLLLAVFIVAWRAMNKDIM